MNWLPTLLHAAGRPGIKEELRTAGVAVAALGRDFRVHLDGYDLTPLLSGESEASPRKKIFDFCDDGNLSALRYTA
jgi:arylsulfatase